MNKFYPFNIMSYLLIIALFVFFNCSNTSDLAELNEFFKGASASFKDDKLINSIGKITRQWKVTESGLKTVSLRDNEQDEEWIYKVIILKQEVVTLLFSENLTTQNLKKKLNCSLLPTVRSKLLTC